ncbi:shikimate kinase [Aedoeadaptatus pacaensis]|uniref:shikimate kinase n=1 Tax=Aedoeadaptatus pacaensis TaxID=1776390 RepID=UPI00083999D0|nr:shikimate kinase [Peptoniphilus pacaensis]
MKDKNIVIIGMPGAGKTSVAEAVAQKLGRKMIDIDTEIVKAHGDIPKIFEKEGEAGFRAYEKQAVAQAAKETSVVIATGGGSLLDRENTKALKSTGTLYWITRPLESLATDGRPLSKGGIETLKKLYNERKEIYAAAADAVVENKSIQTAAEEIIRIGNVTKK